MKSIQTTNAAIFFIMLVVALFARPSFAADFVAPNLVEITPRLETSAQPSAKALESLKAHGFDAVIYLAPSDVVTAVANEEAIVKKQGIEFVHIDIY